MLLQQVLLTSLLFFVSAADEIIVSSNATCETTEPHQRHCQSLVDAAKQVTSNTVIKIADIKYTLAGVARFDGVENVTITGNGKSKTEITCSTKNVTIGAGIIFENSTDIRLKDFIITNCGVTIANSVSNHAGTASAIQIIDCSQVVVSSILVSNSSQGLTFIDTLSSVQVMDSQFINNSIQNRTEWPGGGLQILFMHMNQSNGANYSILRNTFANNTANSQKICYAGKGGGIRILLFNECKNVKMELDSNVIEGNRALNGGGGGLLVILSGNVSHNNIHISSNRFIENTAQKGGGGGAELGFSLYLNGIYQNDKLHPLLDSIIIFNATFLSNRAIFGGGLFLYAVSIEFNAEHPLNNFVCTSCYFKNNKAQNGAALSVNVDAFKITGAQYILSVNFSDCSFEQNQNLVYDSQQKGFGAVYVTLLPVTFNGTTVFVNNTGTALYMASVTVTFDDNSQVVFERNSGYHGGGIHMFGRSELHVCNNSYLKFQNNTATLYGGALSVENNQANMFSFVSVCFLRVSELASSNVTFFFQGNTAQLGNDIYATTLAPCTALCEFRSGSRSDLVTNSSSFLSRLCLGNFSFSNSSDNLTNHVATSPKNITIIGNSQLIKLTPGILSTLNITQTDELGANVSNFFSLSAKVEDSDQCVSVHPDYTIVEKNEIILLGSPKERGQLFLESQGAAGQPLDFELNDCPPGFILENPGCNAKCICFRLISNTSKHYKNLRCAPNGSVQIEYGHWAGYANTFNPSPETLYTGDCHVELCHFDDPKFMTLPDQPAQLEMKICGKNRVGYLCGKCKDNMSVHYHSISYTCGDSTHCKFGIPLYIVSELLPVTIFFSIILLFNISLTSGALYGFVFYAQILSVLYLTAFGSIKIENKFVNGLVVAFQIFLGLFNLDILDGKWEYCVVQTNTIMTLFIIRYITIVYSFLLVAATVMILRLHSCYHCVKICKKCGRRNIRGSIVDGLAAFLMVCYFQCASNTSRILCYSEIYGIGKKFKNVATFDGEMPYLEGEHWFYAVPAFLCIIIILIPPPTILLLEPFLTKLFSRERFTGSYLKWKYYRLRLRLMPFLDSFQACFKDRHRYFAGLYFLYRLVIPIMSLFSQSIAQTYTMTAIMMFLILFIHVVLQPYSKKWHNVVEQSMFFNLILMLCITLYNYMQIHIQDYETADAYIYMYVYVQLVLISLPISYIFCYAAVVIYRKYYHNLQLSWKNTRLHAVDNGTLDTDDSEIPARLLMESSSDPFSNSYSTM